MSKKCFNNFTKATGRTLDALEQEKLLDEVTEFRQEQSSVGQSPTDINPDGTTNIQKHVNQSFKNDTKIKTENVLGKLRQLDANARLSETIDTMEDTLRVHYKNLKTKITPTELRERAFIGTLLNTNDTVGSVPLDLMLRKESSNMFADFHNKVDDMLDEGDDIYKLLDDPDFKKAFWSEYYNITQDPTIVKNATGNKKAFNVAKLFFEESSLSAHTKLTLNGKTMRLKTTGVRVRFQSNLVKKMEAEDFANFLAERLSEKKHGTLGERKTLALKIHEQMVSGDGRSDWRVLGDKKLKDENNVNPFAENENAQLVYRDGDAFTEVNMKFSENAKSKQLVLQHIQELAREISLTRFLGPNHKQGLEALQKLLREGQGGRIGFGDKYGKGPLTGHRLRGVMSWLENQVNPAVHENSKWVTRLGGVRAFMAGSKLGSAVITAINDIPIFITAGKRYFGLDVSRSMGSFFDGTGDMRQARYILEMKESWLDSATERFSLIDGMNNMSKFEKGGSWFAEKIFKYSGLNWWTQTLQAKAAGLYSLNMGDLIKARKSWDGLSKPFKQNLEKFGLDKKDWATLIREAPLDESGRVDLFQIQEKQYEVTFGKRSLRDKLTAIMADAVDTMVMKPSQFDVLSTGLFNDPNLITGQTWKAMTQFKSHPISFYRKLIARSQKDVHQNTVATIAMIMATTTITSMGVLQLKQLIAGKQPYKWDDGEFIARAAVQAGALGIVSDLMLQSGGEELIEQLFTPDEKVRFPTTAEVIGSQLGPAFVDFMKLAGSGGLIIAGGIRQGVGAEDDWKTTKKGLHNFTKIALGTTGLQNLWFTKLLYRKWVSEHLHELFDPEGYRRRERRLRREARKKFYGGTYNNMIFDKVPNWGQ